MPRKCRGSALISAMFIMALVSIAATALISRLQMDIYHTRVYITEDKLYLASELVTFWNMHLLATSGKKVLLAKDQAGLIANFPDELSHSYPDIHIQGELYDLQAKININNLQEQAYQFVWYNVLNSSLKNREDHDLKMLVTATLDWLKPPASAQINRDPFLDTYLQRQPPYYPAYQSMINTSELMMVNGFTPTMYAVIASTIHALPEITPLNLNTTDLHSLLMLSTNSQCQQVADIIQLRAKHGIDNMANVQDLLKKCDIKPSHVTLQSQYFMSVAEVKTGDLQLTNHTLIQRKIDPKGHVKLQVLQSIIN